MPPRELLNGLITYTSARRRDENIVNQLAYVHATQELYQTLWDGRETICALVKHHLCLGRRDACEVHSFHEWIRGSFNICIPVQVKSGDQCKKFMLRCPMPYKLAESKYPGTVDEKLGCEVATYAWMQDNCSNIRIPVLYGFGFSDQRHFTHEQQRPWYIRLKGRVWRGIYRLFRYPDLSRYTLHHTAYSLPSAYMLLEFIEPETGQMLSMSWEKGRHDSERRQQLFRGIARVMLSLARVPFPRIGAFKFHDDCTITLTNRPLTCTTMILENDGAPRTIRENETYSHTEPFVSDMLTFHDNYFLSNPNAIFSEGDCRAQMAVRTLLRTLSHHYIERELRNGPFFLQFTDLHASNIFVNEQWDITCLLDLEWLCSLPAEMLAVPYWLTGRAIDGIDEEHMDEFDKVRQEFMLEFKEEEQKMVRHRFSLASIMEKMWESKGVWYWCCLESVNAMRFVLEDHVCPVFSSPLYSEVENILSRFWRADFEEVVKRKIADNKQYNTELRRLFGEEDVEVSGR